MSPDSKTSLFLWAAGTANGSTVNLNSASSGWAVATAPSLKYLELSSGAYCLQTAGTTTGSAEEIWACDGATAEEWNIVKDASPAGYYQLQQGVTGGTLCLDATGTTSGSAVQGITCNSAAAQQWSGSGL
jgi:hypothetical protein